MKFWIVTNEYLPKKGGLVTYTRNLAMEIRKQGNEVEIVTSNSKDKSLKEIEEIEGIKVHRIDYTKIYSVFKPFAPIAYYYKVKKYIQKLNINQDDVVISRFYYFALAIDKVKKIRKHIFITPLVADKLQYMEAKKSKGIKKLYYYFTIPQIKYLDSKAIKETPYVGVLSNSKKEEVKKAHNIKNKEVYVFEPGIDTNRFCIPSREEKEELRKEKNISIEDKILLCVCRLSPEKNLEILIKAMAQQKNKNIKLYIVGDGVLKSQLKDLIIKENVEENVKLIGAKDDVEKYYKLADVFILPSKYEGFGHVYIEALACGLIIMGSKNNPPECITATDEIIENEKIGYLIQYNNYKEIAEQIEKCFEKYTENIKYRRDYVLSKYTWENHYFNIVRSLKINERNNKRR